MSKIVEESERFEAALKKFRVRRGFPAALGRLEGMLFGILIERPTPEELYAWLADRFEELNKEEVANNA